VSVLSEEEEFKVARELTRLDDERLAKWRDDALWALRMGKAEDRVPPLAILALCARAARPALPHDLEQRIRDHVLRDGKCTCGAWPDGAGGFPRLDSRSNWVDHLARAIRA
jgi:hypothetical protein